MDLEDWHVIALGALVVVGLFGVPGAALINAGWPRRYRVPTCGACRSDVSDSIGRGVCPRCSRSFADTGVVPARILFRPMCLVVGASLALGALSYVGLILIAFST